MMITNHTFAICAYGESPYLEECIKSVISQNDKSNVILVTSTPNSLIRGLCERYSIKMFINEGERGIANDWNWALQCVETKYATITHQDDVYCENYISSVIREMEKQNNTIISFTDYGEIRNDKRVNKTKMLEVKRILLAPLKIKKLRQNRWVRRRILSVGSPICCPSVTYNLKAFEKPLFKSGFKSDLDWEAWEELSKIEGAFVYVPEILMYHRIHDESETSRLINDTGRGVEDVKMLEKFWPPIIARMIAKVYKKSEDFNNM